MVQPRFMISSRAASRRSALCLAAGLAAFACAPALAAPGPERPETSSAGERAGPALREGVAGRVVGRSGRPVAGVLIVPSPAGGGAGPVPELAVQTDGQGRFEWSLRPGRYRLDAVFEGRRVGSRRVLVGPRRVTDIRMALEAIK